MFIPGHLDDEVLFIVTSSKKAIVDDNVGHTVKLLLGLMAPMYGLPFYTVGAPRTKWEMCGVVLINLFHRGQYRTPWYFCSHSLFLNTLVCVQHNVAIFTHLHLFLINRT